MASTAFITPAIPLADSLWPKLGLIWYHTQHETTERIEPKTWRDSFTHRANVEGSLLSSGSEKAPYGRYFKWVSNWCPGTMTFKVACKVMIYAARIFIGTPYHGLLTVRAGVGNSARTTVPIELSCKILCLSVLTELTH